MKLTLGHRCIVYAKPNQQTFLKDGEEGAGKHMPYVLWAYDIEARTQIVEHKISTEFQKENNQFIDFTVLERSMEIQKANLIVFRNVFTDEEFSYFGDACLSNFIQFMMTFNKGRNICVAHNGSGYDSRLICEELSKNDMNYKTSVTSNGTKLTELQAGHTIFRDSLMHLPGSLAGLAKAFELPLMKGTFPHLFNSIGNYDYEGMIPDRKYFDLTFTAKSDKDIETFETWYTERSKTPWNFMTELTNYCRDDVKILAQLMIKHDDICSGKFNLSPWFYSTAPSYCHTVLKLLVSQDLDLERIESLAWDEHWGVLYPQEYWHSRRALIGGRTDVRTVHYRLSHEEISRGVQIRYQDIVSMYPYVQAVYEYPVGLPRIKVYDPKYYPCTKHQSPASGNNWSPCNCSRFSKRADRMIDVEEIETQPTVEYMSDYSTFGIATVSLEPPKNLFHPVLVVWNETSGKRCGSLETIVEKTFTMIEIQRALSKGYKLLKVHRIDLYNKKPGLWSDFVKDLYIEKLANSSPIPSIEEQERLVNAYEEKFGIGEQVRQSFPRWEFRSALRLVYKIMLNSGWGKHCQRPNMGGMAFIHEDDDKTMQKLFSNIENSDLLLKNVFQQGNKTVFTTTPTNRKYLPHDLYLPAGLFVPAYGRLMLYEQLDLLQERVLYHDTDSIVYIYDPLLYNIPSGDIWGEWDEEKVSKNGNITAFVGLGAKSYAIEAKDGGNVIKLKGLTIKRSHSDYINFNSLEELVLNHGSFEIPQRNFVYRMGEGIHITERLKKISFDPLELKGFLHNNKVYPPGYCQGCLDLGPHICQ
jgi:hypothetical protein